MPVDPAREVLLLPFATGALAWPTEGAAWFANAAPLPGLESARAAALRCMQWFKPDVEALARAGYASATGDQSALPLALVLPPRQRDHARAVLADAFARLAPGGALVACAANDAGARSLQADVAQLAGTVQAASKQHCRVVWAQATADAQAAPLVAQWRALDAPRQAVDGWWTRPGVFAWDRIDAASALLIDHLPTDLRGHAADLGAGTGVLAAALLARNPGLAAIDLYEADARALELARRNLAGRPARFHHHDVTGGVPGAYDAIVMNPPFHVGRVDSPDLGRAFIAAAAAALRPGGTLWLVANRHLAYEGELARGFADVRTLAQAHGFKVIAARKDGGR